jgi:exopolysaccharide production protein ExoQ
MEEKVQSNIYFKIAVFVFMAYLFFGFFGTSKPFPAQTDSDYEGGGNIINQLVYTFLFLASLISLFVRRLDAIAIIKKEKVLTIFLIWCLLSTIWSYSPADTLKRFIKTLTLFTVMLSLLVHTSSTKEIFKFVKPVLYLYLILSVVACVVIPGAKDAKFHTWRGFAYTKNLLGQWAIVCTILSYFIFKMEVGYSKLIAAIAILFSLALLFGSRSMTSILTFFIIGFIGLILSADKLFKPLGLGRAASVIIFLFGTVMIVSIIFISPEVISTITEAVGKDPSFSGRTDLWSAMLISISQHPFLGTGFRAFWSVDPPSAYLEHIYSVFIWLPNESHNSYIDLTNELGIIGLGIVVIMIVRYFSNLRKLDSPTPWKWFIMAALIIGLQESVLFNVANFLGVMFIVSYMILFSQLWRQDVEAEGEYES